MKLCWSRSSIIRLALDSGRWSVLILCRPLTSWESESGSFFTSMISVSAFPAESDRGPGFGDVVGASYIQGDFPARSQFLHVGRLSSHYDAPVRCYFSAELF